MSDDFIYFDHSATTPTDPRVVAAMLPHWTEDFGNPSSLHRAGKRAAAALNEARATVASVLNCAPGEVIFTSGGTESDNLALRGVAAAMSGRGRGKHIITTAAEHHAVLDVAHELADDGFDVTFLPVDEYGRVSAEQVFAALRDDTILVSVIYANNEVGTVNPIAEIGAELRQRRIPFHVDAVQAPGLLPLDVAALNVDLLSLSGHKFYGPKGIGVLYARRAVPLKPQIVGGGQQAHRRSGTEPVPLIVGLAAALRIAEAERRRNGRQAHAAARSPDSAHLADDPRSGADRAPDRAFGRACQFCSARLERRLNSARLERSRHRRERWQCLHDRAARAESRPHGNGHRSGSADGAVALCLGQVEHAGTGRAAALSFGGVGRAPPRDGAADRVK